MRPPATIITLAVTIILPVSSRWGSRLGTETETKTQVQKWKSPWPFELARRNADLSIWLWGSRREDVPHGMWEERGLKGRKSGKVLPKVLLQSGQGVVERAEQSPTSPQAWPQILYSAHHAVLLPKHCGFRHFSAGLPYLFSFLPLFFFPPALSAFPPPSLFSSKFHLPYLPSSLVTTV